MDSRETNEIIVKLLAAADKIGHREKDEIMHLVGRLSRATTRERETSLDEMHHLERKIRLLQDEVRRLDHENPLLRNSRVGAYDRLGDDVLPAPHHRTTPLLNYGPSDETRVPPLPAAAPSPQYGYFNEARLLAIKAQAGCDDDDLRRSSSRAPAPPQPSSKNANTQPLGTRGKSRELSTEIGQKRKNPNSTVSGDTTPNKKIKEEDYC